MDKAKVFVVAIGLTVLIAWIYSAYWFPPYICEREGDSWDSWTIECVQKGQTTWDRWFPSKETEIEIDLTELKEYLHEELDSISLKIDKIACQSPYKFENYILEYDLNCEKVKKS